MKKGLYVPFLLCYTLSMKPKKTTFVKDFHYHHIIPRHLGGTNDKKNIAILHPIDHAIIHSVRYRMFGDRRDKEAAKFLFGILDDQGQPKFNNQGSNNHFYGKTHSEESKQKRLETIRRHGPYQISDEAREAKRQGGMKPKSETMKSRLAAWRTGTTMVHKDGKRKYIKKEIIDDYLNNGWTTRK
jgi:hypothetical protein